MFGKKFSSNIRRRKRMVLTSLILLVVFLGIGYSAFTTNLSINGTLNVSKYDQTLYGVLEKAAKKGTYAKEYTGEHHDSFTEEPTKKIYHWYGSSNDNGTAILDMNNVIFANHCWQMIRTTDTGGVKMVYNGEPENNQCLNTRGNHVGYDSRTTQSMSTTYYYGTSYTYDKTNNVFSLDGTITTGTIQTGQYTCKQTTSTGTCATLYLVDTLSSGTTYNVLPLNVNSNYSQFGTLQFNQSYNSPAYVGYMYNTVYPVTSKSQTYYIQNSSMTINTSYYYSDTIDYGNQNTGNYTLTNPVLISTLSDYTTLVGKYVLSSSGTYATQARYVLAVSGTTIYYKTLSDGNINITMQVGDSYTDNGNGTYTINSPTEVTYIDWYNGSYSSNKTKYVCDGTSSTCANVRHIANSTSKNYYYYWGVEHTYKYSESVSYSGGTYTLTGDIKEIWDIPLTTNQTTITTHHYTCLGTGTTCTTVNYINYYSYPNLYYAQLSNVADVSTALTNMLSTDNVNQINSTMKTGIDAWYKRYMTGYTNRLEDTIFCNDRSIKALNGWNPDGGSITSYLQFKNYSSNSDLSCTNITDKFSMANTKAQLTYPVSLLTYPETYLLNNSNIRKTGQSYWLGSPFYFNSSNAYGRIVYTTGGISNYRVNVTGGVRPVVSLTPGTEYTSGSGSMDDPYVIQK